MFLFWRKRRSFRRKNQKRPFSTQTSELLDCSRQSEKRRRNERGTNRRISHCKPIIYKITSREKGIFVRTFKLLKLNTWKSLPSIKQTKIYFPEKCSHRCHFIHRKTDCMASYQFWCCFSDAMESIVNIISAFMGLYSLYLAAQLKTKTILMVTEK